MKKGLIITVLILFSLGIVALWQYFSFNDGKLHVIFCDIGQGDAILVKTPESKYILYDGGPDRAVIHCLAKHMPFWDRTIDLMILSHPHADHFFGMFYVLERYHVKAFATEDLFNDIASYRALQDMLAAKQVSGQIVSAGDSWDVGEVRIEVVGPTNKYLTQTSPGGTIGESKEFASVVLHVMYGEFSMLLTGDSQAIGLRDAEDLLEGGIDVLHIPHHGSGTGLDAELLKRLAPTLAVISVGAENRYNHPHPKVMQLLKSQQIKVLRTDQDGDVEVVSDGRGWEVSNPYY